MVLAFLAHTYAGLGDPKKDEILVMVKRPLKQDPLFVVTLTYYYVPMTAWSRCSSGICRACQARIWV